MYSFIIFNHYYLSMHVLQRLSQLEKLQVLDLSVNSTLREVPEVVYSLSQLTVLNLALCSLSNISDRYVCIKTNTIIPCCRSVICNAVFLFYFIGESYM